jgi:CheY-like chemotaxis protein
VTAAARKRILIVDDASEVLRACVDMLQTLGYSARGATRADAALELLRQDSFHLVILDYRMPETDGFELLAQARTLRPESAYMLLTGHGTAEVVDRARAVGFQLVLHKPFTRAALQEAVASLLGRDGRA